MEELVDSEFLASSEEIISRDCLYLLDRGSTVCAAEAVFIEILLIIENASILIFIGNSKVQGLLFL